MNKACIAGTRALHGPMLESRSGYESAWMQFLPLSPGWFSVSDTKALLNGRVVSRTRRGNTTQFRVRRDQP